MFLIDAIPAVFAVVGFAAWLIGLAIFVFGDHH